MTTVINTKGSNGQITCNVGGGFGGSSVSKSTVVNTGAITGSVTIPASHSHNAYTGNVTTNGNLYGQGLQVSSDANFDGNITWKGRDLGKMLETIEKRLAILVPDPEKLEKYEALRKAYDHYKLLEALCDKD